MSQGNAATDLRRGGQFNFTVVYSSSLNAIVK